MIVICLKCGIEYEDIVKKDDCPHHYREHTGDEVGDYPDDYSSC